MADRLSTRARQLFGVTPDKQTIVFTERVEKLLESHGVKRAFLSLVCLVQAAFEELFPHVPPAPSSEG